MTKSMRTRSTADDSRSGSKAQRTTTVSQSKAENLLEMVASLLWFWGSNGFGQLGFGEDIMERTRPTPSSIKEEILDVATGGMHTIVLLMDGSVLSFGVNDEGALGRPTTEAGAAEGDPTIPGRVTMPARAKRPVKVACTDSASFILTEDGSVYGCGTFRKASGVFGFSPRVEMAARFCLVYKPSYRDSPVNKIVAGGNHMIAILRDGGVISWGDGEQGQLGRIHLRSSRRGSNPQNNMLIPAKIEGFRGVKFVDASCGEFNTFLKDSTGQFYGFGLNNSGQLAIHPAEGVTNEETLDLEDRVAKRVTFLKPTPVRALETLEITSVASGKDHSLGIDKAGRVHSWGVPTYGVLGRQDMIPHVNESTVFPDPGLVTGIEKPVKSVSCGQVISGCIDESGDFYTWGAALNDMLGVTEDEDILVPRKIPRNQSMQDKRFHKLEFGGQHVALLGQSLTQLFSKSSRSSLPDAVVAEASRFTSQ